MVRRLKSELPPRWDGSPRFPKRVLEPLEVAYTEDERRIHAALQRVHRAAARQTPATTAEKFATEFVLKLLKKRLFSSPAAFLPHAGAARAIAAGNAQRHVRPRSRPGASCSGRSTGSTRTTPTTTSTRRPPIDAVDAATPALPRADRRRNGAARRRCSAWAEPAASPARLQGQAS